MSEPVTDEAPRSITVGPRRAPYLGTSFAAGGGVLIVLGAVAWATDLGAGDNFNQVPGVVICAALLVGSLVLAPRVPAPTHGACVAVATGAVPAIAGFALLSDSPDYSAVRSAQVVTILGWVALFFASTMRLRVLFLGLALYGVWQVAIFEAADAERLWQRPFFTFDLYPEDYYSEDYYSEDYYYDDEPNHDEPEDRSFAVAAVSSVVGVGYLLAMRRSDRRHEEAVGTAFAASGTLALALGVTMFGVWVESVGGAGLFALLAGLFCAWTGSGSRRWTTWSGAFLGSVGALLISGDVTDDSNDGEGSVAWFAWLTMLFGVGLAVLATALGRLLGEPGTESMGTAHPEPDPNDADPDGPPEPVDLS